MSTRSLICIPIGTTDDARGRYVHSDGYPTHMGKSLWDIVHRDGVEQARKTLTEDHYAWSSVSANFPVIEGVEPDRDANYGTAPYHAWMAANHESKGYDHVPGYGVAFNAEKGAEEDMWTYVSRPEDTWCQWAYVIADGGLMVGSILGEVRWHGLYRWEDDEPDWSKVECGEHFERCIHYAWVHFPEAEGTYVTTAQWLGTEPLSLRTATHMVLDGEAYTFTGTGRLDVINRMWVSLVVRESDGMKVNIPAFKVKANGEWMPAKGATYLYPSIPA